MQMQKQMQMRTQIQVQTNFHLILFGNVFKNKSKHKPQRQSIATIDSGRTVEIMNNGQSGSAKIIDPT